MGCAAVGSVCCARLPSTHQLRAVCLMDRQRLPGRLTTYKLPHHTMLARSSPTLRGLLCLRCASYARRSLSTRRPYKLPNSAILPGSLAIRDSTYPTMIPRPRARCSIMPAAPTSRYILARSSRTYAWRIGASSAAARCQKVQTVCIFDSLPGSAAAGTLISLSVSIFTPRLSTFAAAFIVSCAEIVRMSSRACAKSATQPRGCLNDLLDSLCQIC